MSAPSSPLGGVATQDHCNLEITGPPCYMEHSQEGTIVLEPEKESRMQVSAQRVWVRRVDMKEVSISGHC